MNRIEHLLVILMEECAEVSQRASKALRFGLQEIEPAQEFTNGERLAFEYTDLRAAWEMLLDDGAIFDAAFSRSRVERKKRKVEKFIRYSGELGRLSP